MTMLALIWQCSPWFKTLRGSTEIYNIMSCWKQISYVASGIEWIKIWQEKHVFSIPADKRAKIRKS